MSEEVCDFSCWEDVINNFFKQKKEVEELKYLKETIKIVREKYSEMDFYGDQELKDFFDAKKNKKSKGQADIEFQRDKALTIIRLKQKPKSIDFHRIIKNYRLRFEKISEKYKPQIWLNENSKNASSVSFATHVIKLTHSKIDSPSLYDQINSQKLNALTTSCLTEKIIDGAVSGNQFAPIFQFLELEFNSEKLATQFTNVDNTILESFSDNNKQLTTWNTGFNRSLSTREKSSHSLAKQVYFPIKSTEMLKAHSYHLLCCLKSSSLAHAIFENIYDDKKKEPRILKEKNKYSNMTTVSFVGKSKVSVTASNHSNASQLNGKRGGKIFLLTTQPPTWQSQLNPPIYKKSLFDYLLTSYINNDIHFLREFLLRFERIDLSIKDPKKSNSIDKWVNSIIDEILFYTSSIQNLPSGWSSDKNIKLKDEHQYFLDPYRGEETFQDKRKATDWQNMVCNDFARWLNRKLVGKEKVFTPQAEHTRMWKQLFAEVLREESEAIEMELKGRKLEETL